MSVITFQNLVPVALYMTVEGVKTIQVNGSNGSRFPFLSYIDVALTHFFFICCPNDV